MEHLGTSGISWYGNCSIFATKVIQRKLGLAIKRTFKAFNRSERDKKDDEGVGDISAIQALTTALASTIGVGNIAGVGTAIAMGGPGAVFWMWVSAFLAWVPNMPK